MFRMKVFTVLVTSVLFAVIIFSGCDKNSTDSQQENNPPQISGIVPNPYTVTRLGITTVTCLANDPDGDKLTYTWESASGSISGTGPAIQWTAPDSDGMFTVSCTVSDGKGGQIKQGVDVEVSGTSNNPPQISSLISSADSVYLGEFATLSCSASDLDGDALTYNWTATAGTFTGSGNSVDWNAPDTTGNCTVTCTVTDGQGGQAEQSIVLHVVEQPVPSDGLMAFFPFEGNARDGSGNNYDGFLQGNADASDGTLNLGDNSTDRVNLPNQIVDGVTNFTAAAWLKIDVVHVPNLNTFYSGANASQHNAFSFWYSRETTNNNAYNKTWRIILDNAGYSFEANDVIEDQSWHHIAVKRDGAFAYLYIDGEQWGDRIAVTQVPANVVSNGFYLGQEQDAVGGAFSQAQSWAGEMDNVRFYNRALDDKEIQALYNEPYSGN